MILSLDVDDHHDAHEKQGSPGFLLPAAELRTAFVVPHQYLEDSGLLRQAPNAKTLREVADLSDFSADRANFHHINDLSLRKRRFATSAPASAVQPV
jgi:hypothetical protein